VLYGEVNKVENLLVKFDTFVQSDELLTVPILHHNLIRHSTSQYVQYSLESHKYKNYITTKCHFLSISAISVHNLIE
jgi:hypothetical protein